MVQSIFDEQQLDENPLVVRRFQKYYSQNSFDQPDSLEEDECATLQNADIYSKGLTNTRKGCTAVGTSSGSTAVVGLGHFYPEGGTKILTRITGGKWQKWDGTTGWTDIITTLTTGLQTNFVVAGNLIFALNGTDNAQSYDGTTETDEGNINTSFPKSKFAIYHQNRVLAAGNGTNGSYLWYSGVLTPRTWDRAANAFKISDQDNQVITALIDLSLTKNNGFIVFKEKSVFFVDSSSTTIANWVVVKIDPLHGCCATRTAVAIGAGQTGGGDVFYLSKEGANFRVRSLIRSISDAVLNQGVISKPIEDILNNVNNTQMANASAFFFDQKYFLAIPSGSSTYNDTLCVLDLRASDPASGDWRWTVYKGWNPNCFDIFQESSVEYMYFGEASGSTKTYRALNGTSDAGTAITFINEGRREDFGLPEIDKNGEHIEVQFLATDDTNVTVEAQFDGGGYNTLGTVNVKDASPTLPIDLPFNLVAPSIVKSKFPIDAYGKWRSVQIRVTHVDLDKTVKYRGYSIAAFPIPLSLGN